MTVRRMFSWEILEILPLLEKFNEESGYGYEIDHREFLAWWAPAILEGRAATFVKVSGKEIVGILGVQISAFPGSKALRSGEVFFYIEPEHRNGMGAVKMIKQYIQWAKDKGVPKCQMVALSSTDTEGKVRQFYESLGFHQVEIGFELKF